MNRLKARIKQLEKKLFGDEDYFDISFPDGKMLTVTIDEWETVWDDVMAGRPNALYEKLKRERDAGNADDAGLICMLEAFDPATVREVWADWQEE